MAITISGNIEVQTDNGQNYTIDADDLGFDMVSTDEGKMGPKLFYEGNYELDNFSVTASVEEYPPGAYNLHEILVDGCQLIQDNLQFNNDD